MLIKAIVPQMVKRKQGTVINITSTVAYEDPPEPAGKGGQKTEVGGQRSGAPEGKK